MALDFPWAAVIKANMEKQRSRPDYLQQGLEGASGILGGLQQYQRGKALKSAMGGMNLDPQTQALVSTMMQVDPQSAMKYIADRQSDIPVTMGPSGISLGSQNMQQPTAGVGGQMTASGGVPPPGTMTRRMKPEQAMRIYETQLGREENQSFRKQMQEDQNAFRKDMLTWRKSETEDAKNTARQDKLGKEYADRIQRIIGARTGELGLQNQKVDQAIHLRNMVNQSWNPQTRTYELPEMQQGELVMGLANLVSGSSVSNIEQLKSITPKTAQGDVAHMVSYWTGKPVTNQPQEMIKNLVSSIDRQGQVSEKLRDKYVNGLKDLVPKGLDVDRADSIRHVNFTSSFNDILKNSPDQQSGGQGKTMKIGRFDVETQ